MQVTLTGPATVNVSEGAHFLRFFGTVVITRDEELMNDIKKFLEDRLNSRVLEE